MTAPATPTPARRRDQREESLPARLLDPLRTWATRRHVINAVVPLLLIGMAVAPLQAEIGRAHV